MLECDMYLKDKYIGIKSEGNIGMIGMLLMEINGILANCLIKEKPYIEFSIEEIKEINCSRFPNLPMEFWLFLKNESK